MNKIFDLHRLGMVIRWDIHTYWKKYLGITAGLTIGFSLYYLLQLHFIGNLMTTAGDTYYQNWFLGRMGGMPLGFTVATFYVLATCIFTNMKDKFEREAFIMLPANNLEKFIARLLMMGVGSIIMASIACLIADLVQLAFSFYFTPGHHSSVTLSAFKLLTMVTYGSKPLQGLIFHSSLKIICLSWSLMILFHSFATLGGAVYRKHPILLTACTGLVMSLIFTFGGMKLAEWGFFDLFPSIDYDNEAISLCLSLLWAGIFLGLAAICYWASYKIFTRMQVICNKWVNI